MSGLVPVPRVLTEEAWHERQRIHAARVAAWIEPHQARAARGEKHPVHDFLFGYYAFRPAWLRRWHPGPDVFLAGVSAREFLRWREYQEVALPNGAVGVSVDPSALAPRRREFVGWLIELLAAMQTRPAFYGCHGWHEWAMVYRQATDDVRHQAQPLRFSAEQIARIVEAQPLCCSHFDAFRFFTEPARPLNKLRPTREDAPGLEQRGCLHANMDLYKWAFKLAPFTPAETIADCFALARDIREVDMRASPYDLRALGYAPIAVETSAGRAEYEAHQRAFAARGEPLRAGLLALARRLQVAWTSVEGSIPLAASLR